MFGPQLAASRRVQEAMAKVAELYDYEPVGRAAARIAHFGELTAGGAC